MRDITVIIKDPYWI